MCISIWIFEALARSFFRLHCIHFADIGIKFIVSVGTVWHCQGAKLVDTRAEGRTGAYLVT